MSRYFALPVLATMLALVGVRLTAGGERAEKPLDIVVSLPVQDPLPEPAPQEKPAEPVLAPPPSPPPPAPPKAEPVIIILEPLPAPAPVAPPPQPAPVVVTQTTVVNNTTNIFYPPPPPMAVEPEPTGEVVEVPVMVVGCAAHRRPGCCLAPPRHAAPKPRDGFFKRIPFLPPTPRGPRYNP